MAEKRQEPTGLCWSARPPAAGDALSWVPTSPSGDGTHFASLAVRERNNG